MKKTMIALAVGAALGMDQATAADLTLEQKVEILQQEIDALKAQLAKNQEKTAAAAVDQAPARPADSGVGATTVGGYGEIAYNRYHNTDAHNSEADLRRFVLFLGHKFNDDLRFFSELEVEHAVASRDDAGEVELEQAYLDYRLNDQVSLKAGLFLIPLGILNETHEPPTYYGVERNEVETRIIPTTWREGGVGVYGEVGEGFHYDLGITTGFDAAKIDNPSFGIRSGHQELQLAKANNLSAYAALNYRGRPGLLLGGGIFTGDTSQNGASLADPGARALLNSVGAQLTLWDLHAKYNVGNWDLQALYARGTLNNADTVAAALVAEGTPVAIPKVFDGWYMQAAYPLWKRGDMDLTPFYRHEKYNTQREVAAGFTPDPNNNETVQTLGVNFLLHPQVVLKADYQKFKTDSTKDRIDLGLGYMF
jgi:uncharacterized small protein (DUF1192 family)